MLCQTPQSKTIGCFLAILSATESIFDSNGLSCLGYSSVNSCHDCGWLKTAHYNDLDIDTGFLLSWLCPAHGGSYGRQHVVLGLGGLHLMEILGYCGRKCG